jgi:hypothetical protein
VQFFPAPADRFACPSVWSIPYPIEEPSGGREDSKAPEQSLWQAEREILHIPVDRSVHSFQCIAETCGEGFLAGVRLKSAQVWKACAKRMNPCVRVRSALVAPAVLPAVGLHGLGITPAAKTAGATLGK